jgi:hypothetical protein
MSLHIVHFIGPINATSACTVRHLCLQALQSGEAAGIELTMSTVGGPVNTARRARLLEAGATPHWCN